MQSMMVPVISHHRARGRASAPARRGPRVRGPVPAAEPRSISSIKPSAGRNKISNNKPEKKKINIRVLAIFISNPFKMGESLFSVGTLFFPLFYPRFPPLYGYRKVGNFFPVSLSLSFNFLPNFGKKVPTSREINIVHKRNEKQKIIGCVYIGRRRNRLHARKLLRRYTTYNHAILSEARL